MAEEGRFELPDGFPPTVFKTVALNHSSHSSVCDNLSTMFGNKDSPKIIVCTLIQEICSRSFHCMLSTLNR